MHVNCGRFIHRAFCSHSLHLAPSPSPSLTLSLSLSHSSVFLPALTPDQPTAFFVFNLIKTPQSSLPPSPVMAVAARLLPKQTFFMRWTHHSKSPDIPVLSEKRIRRIHGLAPPRTTKKKGQTSRNTIDGRYSLAI